MWRCGTDPSATYKDLDEKMEEAGVSSILVVQEGKLMEVAKDRSESFRRRFFLFTDLLILAEDKDKPGCTSLFPSLFVLFRKY